MEGLAEVVSVERAKEWEIERKQMMEKAQAVIDDPANKWILKIPHVIRMQPSTLNTFYEEPTTPAVGIVIYSGKSRTEVEGKVPTTIGGFPTTFGWGEGLGECFTRTRKQCDAVKHDGTEGD